MSYAPHTNTDVHHQLLAKAPNPLPILLGQFMEREFGHRFEYAERRWPDDEFYPELPHIIYVGNGEARLAKVQKKIAFVLTGEGEIQRWEIKEHHNYKTDWVGR